MGNTMCGEHSCVCWKLEEEGRGFLQQKNRPKSSFLLWLIGFSFGLWMLCLYSNEVVSRGTSRNRRGERIKTLSVKDVQNVRNWTVCCGSCSILSPPVTWSLCVSSMCGVQRMGTLISQHSGCASEAQGAEDAHAPRGARCWRLRVLAHLLESCIRQARLSWTNQPCGLEGSQSEICYVQLPLSSSSKESH